MNRRERRRSRLLDGRLPAMRTAATFPAGVRIVDGHCQRCTARGRVPLVDMTLEPFGVRYDVCAECLADFAAGAPEIGARVYVRTIEGSTKEVRARA